MMGDSHAEARRRLNQMLIVRLMSIQGLVGTQLEAALAATGLTHSGFRLVGVLMEQPEGVRQRELADRLGVRAPTVSAALPRLEALGIVERVNDPDDPRAWRVRLRQNAPLLPGVELLEALDRGAFSVLTKNERRTLTRLLDRVGQHLSRKVR